MVVSIVTEEREYSRILSTYNFEGGNTVGYSTNKFKGVCKGGNVPPGSFYTCKLHIAMDNNIVFTGGSLSSSPSSKGFKAENSV